MPLITQNNGFAANRTGSLVAFLITKSRYLSIDEPPDNHIPELEISDANSGGDASKALRMPETI